MSVAGNVAARLAALGAILVTTLVLAWEGGPAAVGLYALLHVLPGLVGTVVSCGLVVAVPFFLAGPRVGDRRLPATVATMAFSSGLAGAGLWAALAPGFAELLFAGLDVGLVAAAGAAVLTRLAVTSAKACAQGGGDLPGANLVIVLEEVMYLPAYAGLRAAGLDASAAVVLALPAADVATALLGWGRLARRGFFIGALPPSRRLARELAGYGLRAQTGGLIAQLNLRLDFVILSALTGPAVLGVYAIASKFAELLRVLTMAITYVLYPAYARDGRRRAAARARSTIPRAGLLTAGAAGVLWLSAPTLIPAVYGPAFANAVLPARIVLVGLALEGTAAVITAFLYGAGRPGLNSCAMAAGLVVTVALDLALISSFGAVGAAIASATAYATASLALLWMFNRVGSADRPPVLTLSKAEAR
jgi:O-antigen/teichoic acid export membrane protein